MNLHWGPFPLLLLLCALGQQGSAQTQTFRVGTYNVENYLVEPTQSRYAKSPEARAAVRENIRLLNPDVLALQELGGSNALQELRASLKGEGVDFPFSEHVDGFDTNIQVCILSKFAFTARRPHTNESFLLSGRRFRVSRGFAEVDVRVNPNYSFTLLCAHLKSRRPVPEADESELRTLEAKRLREKVDALMAADPGINLIVLGDFNDTKDSPAMKSLVGRGKQKLLDLRPTERNGDPPAKVNRNAQGREATWTYFFEKEDSYSRIDYILLSPGMAREWLADATYVLATPGWGTGSDHRPLLATFEATDK